MTCLTENQREMDMHGCSTRTYTQREGQEEGEDKVGLSEEEK